MRNYEEPIGQGKVKYFGIRRSRASKFDYSGDFESRFHPPDSKNNLKS